MVNYVNSTIIEIKQTYPTEDNDILQNYSKVIKILCKLVILYHNYINLFILAPSHVLW